MLRTPRDPLGDPDAVIRRVYAYVAYRIGDGADAEDVTGQTIERAVRYRASFDPSRGEPIAWVIGIARSCIDDFLRARRSTSPLDEADGLADHASSAIDRVDLMSALGRLDRRDRELIALRYGADLSTREIARELEMSPGAVDVALHRCRQRLRGMLDDETSSGAPTFVARDVPATGNA